MTQTTNFWVMAKRAERMNPSAIREILKITEQPNIISFAGGLPSPKTFPIAEFKEACEVILTREGRAALQYATSEGFGPLREQVTQLLPWRIDASQVLITTGSQQGLDLVSKLFIDKDSRVLVETPTYLGALQAFTPMEPEFTAVQTDADGVLVDDFKQKAGQGDSRARFMYVLPNFQNPTGRTMVEERRAALSAAAAELGIPLIEDNPYGDLWFDSPPALPLTARNPQGCIYLGSFSKILAPGLRMGFVIAPNKEIYSKLLQAKQAADLHAPSINQRLISEVMQGGFLDRHIPTIRALYKHQRDVMLEALAQNMPQGVSWNKPLGGMFLWLRLPEHIDTTALLPKAVERGVAFVPGEFFYAENKETNTLRLSFVTASVEEIHRGVKLLADVIAAQG